MIGKILTPIINVFKFHKKKIGVYLLAVVIFSLLLFKYNDLSNLVSSKMAELTDGSVMIQFEDLGISFLPLGIKLSKVSIDSPRMPSLKAESFWIAPAVWSSLTGNPGLKIRFMGFLEGSLYLEAHKSSKDKKDTIKIKANWKQISVKDLLKLQNINLPIIGHVDGEIENLVVEPNFTKQPSGRFVLKSKGLQMGATAFALPIGPMEVPEMKFSELELITELADSSFQIEVGRFGSAKDKIYGNFTGTIGTTINFADGRVRQQLTSYKINLDLRVKEEVTRSGIFSLALGFIEKCRTGGQNGTLSYRCALESSQFGLPPKISTF